MINISRLALIAVAVAGIAAPAFAQSFDPEFGTGNTLPFAFSTTNQQSGKVTVARHARIKTAARQNGLNAFAMVPGGASGSALSPAATGGGSIGYNENLRRNQW
jgi:hypothetical protein